MLFRSRGLTFREVFIVPESASDRYPPSVLGKAALIVGLDMMLAMFNDLTTKAKIPNIGILTGPIAAMATTVRTAAVDRERCRQIEASLGGTMAICYGYVTDRRLMEADAFKAFESHAKRQVAAVAQGKSLARVFRMSGAHQDAADDALSAFLQQAAASLAAVAASTAWFDRRELDGYSGFGQFGTRCAPDDESFY